MTALTFPPQTEVIAAQIRHHQVHVNTGWEHHDLIASLHEWADRFNAAYSLKIPAPVIGVERLPRNCLAIYHLGHAALGVRTQILFNSRWLIHKPPYAEVLATLIHELLHAQEEWVHGRRVGGWYHTAAWRAAMREIGIVADNRGHHIEVLPKFVAYLKEHGIDDADVLLAATPEHAALPTSKTIEIGYQRQLTKWCCRCPGGRPARATFLNAVCIDCGQPYKATTAAHAL